MLNPFKPPQQPLINSTRPTASWGMQLLLSSLTGRRRAKMLRRKTRLTEGEARDAGAEGVFRRNAISRESPVQRRQVGGLEPTVAREHVCGPDVISTATVKGAREISAGRSPLAKHVARAVRARRNHVGGVPANCGSVSPERSEPRSGRYAGCEQVGPSPRLPKPKHPRRGSAASVGSVRTRRRRRRATP